MLQGVAVCGDLSALDTGIYRRLPPHDESVENFLHRLADWEGTHDEWLREDACRMAARAAALQARLHQDGNTQAHQDLATVRRVYEATLDEVQKGLMGPEMSEEELRAKFEIDGKLTVRVLPRFGALQGWTEKRCDTCKRQPGQCHACEGQRMRKLPSTYASQTAANRRRASAQVN
jgi:hypothetical protein